MDHPSLTPSLNIVEFLHDLAARGESLALVEGNLQYSTPDLVPNPATVSAIRAHRQALVGWLGERAAAVPFALSAGQQGLWMAWRLDPHSPVYNIALVARLQESVDAQALQAAFQALADRHPALRTRYGRGCEDAPLQRVDEAFQITLQEIDGRGWSREEVAQWSAAEADRPFDLENGPLMRLVLLHATGADGTPERLLHWTLHHIASDFLSQEILIDELEVLYGAVRQGQTPDLPAPVLGYRDFVRWEQDTLSGEGEALHNWWHDRVAHWPPAAALPADLAPVDSGEGIYRAATLSLAVEAGLTADLRALARAQRVSFFTLLLTGWQIVLARYTGRERFVLTTPTSMRHLSGWDHAAGYYINPLCFEADLGGAPSVADLLARVQASLGDAFAHQGFPFQEVLRLARSAGAGEPGFGFILDTASAPASAPSVFADILLNGQRGTPEPVSLSMYDMGGDLSGQITYDASRYAPATMQRLADALYTVLCAMAEDAERPVIDLPLVDAATRARILTLWSGQGEEPGEPEPSSLPILFRLQAARTPHTVALTEIGEDGRAGAGITFAGLDRWSDAIARRLHARGAGRDTVVGIHMDRSIAIVAGLLGILKAGAAYLPLDPSYPQARLAYMLRDSGASLLLTTAGFAPHAPKTTAALNTLEVDREADLAAPEGGALPEPPGPEDLAYIIYTSGSTGQPKGVQATHRAAINRFAWMWREISFAVGEVCAQKTALSFVDSVWEIFGPLLQGVPSVILPVLLVRDAPGLVGALAAHRVSRLVLVPSLLRALLDAEPQLGGRLPMLAEWICSGEALPAALVRCFQAACPEARLINLYGSSEVAADVTCYDTQAFVPKGGSLPAAIPIGRPIDNAWCYVLDERLEPVPPGAEGELYVGGLCLARGYHRQAEMTAERFIANPFAPGRLFRTGDRARWLPHSDEQGRPLLAMLGRRDSQVKIRGFRVDLAEITACLRQNPAVTEAVVQAREHETGLRLVAAVAAPEGVTAADLHRYLGRVLPEHMVPGGYIILERLPLTPNGKVDLQALANMDPDPATEDAAHEPPEGALEQALAGIWRDILCVDRIGRHDNFFLLGGHSLLATRIAVRIHAQCGVALPLREVFDHPTLAGLAARIAAQPEMQAMAGPLSTPPRQDILPLSFAQERLWVLDRFDSIAAAYTVPLALRLRGALDQAALRAALARLAARHESLRTTFPDRDGVPFQRIAAHMDLPLEAIDLPAPAAADLVAALRAEAARPFDLVQGPLVRAALFRLGAEDHVFLLSLHHIIADGWSLGVLGAELDALYGAEVSGAPLALPPLALHPADHALQGRAAAEGPQWQAQLEAWRARLDDPPTLLDLPTDRTRPPVQDTRCAALLLHLDAALTEGLEHLGQQHGASLFMVVQALWAMLLARHTGEADMVIGAPVAGRTHPALEPLVGCFVNTLPLRVDLSGDPSFSALLARVRETTLDAYGRQTIPVEQVLNALNLERSLSHSPLFQTMLTVEYAESHPAARRYRLGDVAAEWLDLGRRHSEIDLGLELIRSDDGLRGWIDYSTALFDAVTIARMAGHLQTLAGAAVAEPERALSVLPMLQEDERRQILALGVPVGAHATAQETVQALFEQQVARTPDAVAVIVAEPGLAPEHCPRLTYAELNARANRLARSLLALRTDPGAAQPHSLVSADLRHRLVGLCLGRSADMLVAFLGALKAGFACVPLDPTWPPQRIADILEDADPVVLITEPGLLEAAQSEGRILVSIDRLPLAAGAPEDANPAPQGRAGDVAYIMYTSGSTGKPKGVVTEHRNVTGYTRSFTEWAGLTAADRALQHGSLAFDICIEEIFPQLSVGASVVICVDPAGVEAIADDAIRHRVTMVCTTPLLTQYFNSRAAEAACVRFLASGGDVLRPAEISDLLAQGIGVYNSYGPTESTVTATSHIAGMADSAALPIGRPLPHARAFVLDAQGGPVPFGVAGELHIGGGGVARGYLNRPDLTEAQFVMRQGPQGPERMYRTGDRARWRADGTLEFVGRMDRQVKIRGFRVELGEIEAAFTRHAGVNTVAVLPDTDADGQKRLAAYVVPVERGCDPATLRAGLREHLRESLPGYMIPGRIAVLDTLPLTPTGKIDRKALPQAQEEDAPQAIVRPRSVVEQDLLAIWREVLQNNSVRIFENFFELGGHSLAAVRLMARVATEFGTRLPLQALFRHPTIAELAAHLQAAAPEAAWSTVVALQPQGERPPLFCIPGDGGNVFYFHPLARALGPEQPVYGLESVGLDGRQAPHATVEEAAAHHVAQIRARWPQGPYCLAGHSFGGLVAYEMAQQLHRASAPVGMLAILDTLPPSMPLPVAREEDLIVTFERLFSEEYGAAQTLTALALEALDGAQRLEALRAALERIGALPAGAGVDHVRAIFEVFRVNTQTVYHPADPAMLPFTLLLAQDTPDEAERAAMVEGWSRLGIPDVRIVPGSHTTMTYPPHVEVLAQRLRACLAAC